MMSSNVNRLMAEQDIRTLSVVAAATSQSEKGFQQTNEGLKREMGDVFKKPEAQVVREGLRKLKELSKSQLALKM